MAIKKLSIIDIDSSFKRRLNPIKKLKESIFYH